MQIAALTIGETKKLIQYRRLLDSSNAGSAIGIVDGAYDPTRQATPEEHNTVHDFHLQPPKDTLVLRGTTVYVPNGTSDGKMQKKVQADHDEVIGRCLAAFVQAGTLDLSLDQIATRIGISKRMLVHYFGGREAVEEKQWKRSSGREAVEERAMSLLEDRLRAQFAPDNFPSGAPLATTIAALWGRTIAPESRGILLLVMELSRRAWNGSARAKAAYEDQQRLWVELLLHFISDRVRVEGVLQLFQGAVLAFLITGDATRGGLALQRLASS